MQRFPSYLKALRVRTHSTHGLTLIETLLAIGIFGIAMAGLVAGLLGAMSSASFSKAQTIALQDGKAILEHLALQVPEGDIGDAGSLVDVANNINTGQALGAVPAFALPANLPLEQVRVNIFTGGNVGNQPVWGAEVLPAGGLPTATRDEYEIVVTVRFNQAGRTVDVTVRTVRNILSLT